MHAKPRDGSEMTQTMHLSCYSIIAIPGFLIFVKGQWIE